MNNIDQALEIFCVFTTNLDDQYKLPKNPLNLKASSTNTDLNDLVKQILSKLNKPTNKDFDFLINGDILRGDIRSHLLKHKIENEKNIVIEYEIALNEPKPEKTSDTQNWLNQFFLTEDGLMSCLFNGDVKLFNDEFSPVSEYNLLDQYDEIQQNINSYCLIEKANHMSFVFSNYFGEMYVSNIKNGKLLKTEKLVDLESTIESYCANPLSDSLFCSGDSNGNLCIWNLADNNKSEIVRSKQKLHNHSITNVMWFNEQEILTTGLDDQLLISDVNTLKPNYSVYLKDNTTTSVDFIPSAQTILTGHINGTIRMFDDRSRDKTSKAQFKSHNSFVSSIKHCPGNDNIFVSGCYEGKIKLWDFRMNLPLYTIDSHFGNKIFDLVWLGKLIRK